MNFMDGLLAKNLYMSPGSGNWRKFVAFYCSNREWLIREDYSGNTKT